MPPSPTPPFVSICLLSFSIPLIRNHIINRWEALVDNVIYTPTAVIFYMTKSAPLVLLLSSSVVCRAMLNWTSLTSSAYPFVRPTPRPLAAANSKSKTLRIQIHSIQNVGKVWSSRKQILLETLHAIPDPQNITTDRMHGACEFEVSWSVHCRTFGCGAEWAEGWAEGLGYGCTAALLLWSRRGAGWVEGGVECMQACCVSVLLCIVCATFACVCLCSK